MEQLNKYDILKSVCCSRKSTRTFADAEIPPDNIQKILDVALTSPYASGRKNWEILTVSDKEKIRQMAAIVRRCTLETASVMDEELGNGFRQYTSNFTFFEEAPLLFVLTFRVQPVIAYMMKNQLTQKHLEWERDNYTKSISCVAMLILLAAESLDYGACYMTGPLFAQDELGKLLNVKNGREIGAIIPVGLKK